MGYGPMAQTLRLLLENWKPFLGIVVPAVLIVWLVLPASVAIWFFILAFVGAVGFLVWGFFRNLRRGWRGEG